MATTKKYADLYDINANITLDFQIPLDKILHNLVKIFKQQR